MNWYFLWIICCIYCVQNTELCSPPDGWSPTSPEKRAAKADIVLYGTVVSTPRVNQTTESEGGQFYSVILRVHCIVKGPRIPEFVHVTGFSNFSGGLCVHSKVFLNNSYIVFVERKDDNPEEFQVMEVNLQKGAVPPGHLRKVMLVAGENASLPERVKKDSKPGCPHFKGRFRDPTTHRSKQRHCRCKKKKHKRKKRKRIKTTSRPRKPSWNIHNEVPTFPRTRRYSNVLSFEDQVESFNNINSQSVEVLALRSHGCQLNTDWYWYLLTVYWIFRILLPT